MENINMKSTQLVADSYKSYHHSVYLYIYYKIGKDEEAKDSVTRCLFAFDGL